MRVANYYRVSTKLQQDRFSLAAQKTELQAYAEKQKWVLVNEFIDVETGGQLEKSGLNSLLDLVENGKIDAVLCMDQDRLSRLDTVSWEYLKSVLRENNVKIAEPNGTITDLGNEDDEFMSDLRNLIARREKKSVVKRMMYGKRQRLRDGKGWGQAPFEYEYSKDDARYYIKPGWEWTIPLIDELYLEKNMGCKSISDHINTVSPTPTGGQWNEHLIHTRLESTSFHGVQTKEFSTGEVIATPGIFEPMRTEETYRMIQKTRIERRERFSVATRTSEININLLKYVSTTCGYCGRTLFIQQHGAKNKPRFYAYHGRAKSVRTGETCSIMINAKRYEYNLIKALKEILQSEELSKKYIDFETNDEDLQKLKRDIDKSRKALTKLNVSKDKLLDLYLDPESNMDKDYYTKKNNALESKIRVMAEQVEKIDRKIAAINKKEWNYDSLYEYIEIANSIGTDLTRHEQAQIIGNIFTRAVLTEDILILTTEIYNGIPVEVKVPVVDNVWTVNKWMREDKRNKRVIYCD